MRCKRLHLQFKQEFYSSTNVQKEGDKELTSVLQVSGMSFGHDLLIESVIANIEENA